MLATETKPAYIFLSNPAERKVLQRRGLELLKSARRYNLTIMLDKSARPLAQLVNEIARQEGRIMGFSPIMPNVRFVNIGKEKEDIIRRDWASLEGVSPLVCIEQLTAQKMTNLFGQENVDYLTQIFNPARSGRKIIVDDTCNSAITRQLAMKIASIMDPKSEYSFFEFLESSEDKEVFIGEGNYSPKLPWGKFFTLVADSADPKSFQVVVQNDSNLIYAQLVRKEIKILAHELTDPLQFV